MRSDLETVLVYHETTKHHLHAYARGPGRLDWATQPDPFRRYSGCEALPLERRPGVQGPPYESAFAEGATPPAPLNADTLSQLFFDSLALSAWKRAGAARWALRVNPSSGNLHPTEAYLVCGPVAGLGDAPLVAHYDPPQHALEVRARFSPDRWRQLARGLPPDAVLIGLASIHWREAWKYGERAHRYCQLDTGHAIGAVAMACAALGWKTTLIDEASDADIIALLGLPKDIAIEAERPGCLLVAHPVRKVKARPALSTSAIAAIAGESSWSGAPNRLSPDHRHWAIIDEVDRATHKPAAPSRIPCVPGLVRPCMSPAPVPERAPPAPAVAAQSAVAAPLLRRVIRARRSAVDMDGRTTIPAAAFFGILAKCMPKPGHFPFNSFPWEPHVDMVLFVHRVDDVAPGLCVLVRNPARAQKLRAAFDATFLWEPVPRCPRELPLYRLAAEDCRALAARVSCHQDIAADGAFAVAMLAEFDRPLNEHGPWFYRALHWECGLIGQLLYLEAGARGVRATGIGCFFDDAVHHLLGVKDRQFQDLYHFTLGGAVEDARLLTLPAYPET